jgi:hypothetical protein
MTSPEGLLQAFPLPSKIWEDLSIDFITRLSTGKYFDVIFVVVNHLSEYIPFPPLKHSYTAISLYEVFITEIVQLHCISSSVVSDRDPIFVSNFWQKLFKL